MNHKKLFLTMLVGCFMLNSAAETRADDDPPKLISLGLNAATAMASQKDVVKGLKQAAADEYTDWLWEAVGGTEKFITGNAEAEIPAAKDKIMKIVNTVKAIENFAIAVTEGRYDDAAFVAIDEVVGTLNHPLVTVTWEMAKLTYESHKLVQSTGAARDIEALYAIVAHDRRIMGTVDPNADAPAQIPVNAVTADYFFDKYIVTDSSARGLLKSYVTTQLGQEWPEESWSDYMSSWMAVGSGVDTAKSAEINMLAGEWRNKARGWIVNLLNEANKQAKVAWGEARLRQQMAEFEKFSERVGHFYDNDFDRMIREFLSIKANQAAEAELLKLPQESSKVYAQLSLKIEKMEDKDLKEAGRWEEQINHWQLTCLSGSSKMISVNEGLSKTLSDERRKWLDLADVLSKKMEEKKGRVYEAVEEETFPDREYGSHPSDQTRKSRNEAYEARAKQFYQELFAPLIVELDWLTIRKDVEFTAPDGRVESAALIADTNTALDDITARLNLGDFEGAAVVLEFWRQDAAAGVLGYWEQVRGNVKKILSREPDSLVTARENYSKANAEHEKLAVRNRARNAELSKKRDAVIKKYRGFYGTNWDKVEADSGYQSLSQAMQALDAEVLQHGRSTVNPARDRYETEYNGWAIVASMVSSVLDRIVEVETMLHQKVVAELKDALSAYSELRTAQQQNYEQYVARCNAILADLPMPDMDGFWMGEDDLALVEQEAYTFMAKPSAAQGPASARDMANFLSTMVPAEATGYVVENLRSRAMDIEAKAKVWDTARKQFAELPVLDDADVDQIRVLVKHDFDPEALRESIKERIAYAGKLKELPEKFRAAARKAATDQENREKDRDHVQKNVQTIVSFFNGLQEQGLIRWGSQDYEIVLSNVGREGMVKLDEPYPHYATRDELLKLAGPVRDAWSRMAAASFAAQYAPDHVAKWERIMNLEGVTAAKGENFIAPNYDLPIYKEDLDKALILVNKVKGGSDNYRETMEQVAELVPGLMQVPTVIDNEHDAKMAALYKMDLQEYKSKYTKRSGPVVRYILSSAAEDMLKETRAQGDMEKLYLEIAKRVQELNGEALDAEARRQYEAYMAANQAGQSGQQPEETQRGPESMSGFELSGFYGYSIQDTRINSKSTAVMAGDVVLTKGDLIAGEIIVEGRLFTIDKARTILLSEDGGRTWRELPLSQNISYRFQPMPGKMYDFALRIKTTDEREVELELLPGINSIIYQDVEPEQLAAQTLKEIADAYEMMNASLFSEFISRDYLGNKAILEEGVRFDFDMFMNIRLTIYINRISRRGNMYVAETKWDKSQTPRKTGQEQKTSGKTTFMFVLEEGKMKIQNLRGDLIYATLSPQIAQASGKSSTVVDQILSARDNRNPVQPGAGDTEDAGGLTADAGEETPVASLLTVHTATLTGSPGMTLEGYIDFETGATGVGTSGDIYFGGNIFFESVPAVEIDYRGSGEALFNSLNEVPGDYADELDSDVPSVGHVYVIATGQGNYVKMYVSNIHQYPNPIDPEDPDYFDVTIKYAISGDGTTNLRTQ